MSKIHTNNELDSFVFDMKPQSIFNPEVGLDKIWQRLLEDVCDYETRKNNPMYSECVPKNYSLVQSDRPDIIYQNEDYIMGIECFEFDASRKTRKGSMQKQKMHEANCEANKDYMKLNKPKDGFLSIKRTIDVDLSIQYYYESLLSNFKMHTDSITKYRQNLFKIAPEKKQLLTFFIKDDTALGNYVVINGKTETLNPMRLPLVLKILADTKGLDYVIFRIKEFYVPYLIIQPLSISILRNLLSNCYDSNAKYLQYQFMQDYHFWQTR